ncbi:MAG: lysophospholipid acyltransferase family protein [Synoicihabitans sp.]
MMGIEVVCAGKIRPGVMLAPNHVGYLDILVMASLTPAVFVGKAEVKGWPVFGWFARWAGSLFIRRERKSDLVRVGEQLAPVLEADVNLIIFLEGTSTDGSDMRKFRPGLLEPIVRTNTPVAPVCISYTVSAPHDAGVDVGWWGTMPLAPHLVKLAGLPDVKASVVVGEPVQDSPDRKQLANALESWIRSQLRG